MIVKNTMKISHVLKVQFLALLAVLQIGLFLPTNAHADGTEDAVTLISTLLAPAVNQYIAPVDLTWTPAIVKASQTCSFASDIAIAHCAEQLLDSHAVPTQNAAQIKSVLEIYIDISGGDVIEFIGDLTTLIVGSPETAICAAIAIVADGFPVCDVVKELYEIGKATYDEAKELYDDAESFISSLPGGQALLNLLHGGEKAVGKAAGAVCDGIASIWGGKCTSDDEAPPPPAAPPKPYDVVELAFTTLPWTKAGLNARMSPSESVWTKHLQAAREGFAKTPEFAPVVNDQAQWDKLVAKHIGAFKAEWKVQIKALDDQDPHYAGNSAFATQYAESPAGVAFKAKMFDAATVEERNALRAAQRPKCEAADIKMQPIAFWNEANPSDLYYGAPYYVCAIALDKLSDDSAWKAKQEFGKKKDDLIKAGCVLDPQTPGKLSCSDVELANKCAALYSNWETMCHYPGWQTDKSIPDLLQSVGDPKGRCKADQSPGGAVVCTRDVAVNKICGGVNSKFASRKFKPNLPCKLSRDAQYQAMVNATAAALQTLKDNYKPVKLEHANGQNPKLGVHAELSLLFPFVIDSSDPLVIYANFSNDENGKTLSSIAEKTVVSHTKLIQATRNDTDGENDGVNAPSYILGFNSEILSRPADGGDLFKSKLKDLKVEAKPGVPGGPQELMQRKSNPLINQAMQGGDKSQAPGGLAAMPGSAGVPTMSNSALTGKTEVAGLAVEQPGAAPSALGGAMAGKTQKVQSLTNGDVYKALADSGCHPTQTKPGEFACPPAGLAVCQAEMVKAPGLSCVAMPAAPVRAPATGALPALTAVPGVPPRGTPPVANIPAPPYNVFAKAQEYATTWLNLCADSPCRQAVPQIATARAQEEAKAVVDGNFNPLDTKTATQFLALMTAKYDPLFKAETSASSQRGKVAPVVANPAAPIRSPISVPVKRN